MATAQGVLHGNGDDPHTLVIVFLRGGADGLNIVAPIEDDDYHRARPRLAIAKKGAAKLDDLFGFHPLMKDLKPIYDDGMLAVVHGAGSEDETRSHFEAQDLIEHGGLAGGGWLGRYLRYRPRPSTSALCSVAFGTAMPECLRGAPSATVMKNIEDFSLGQESGDYMKELAGLYAGESGQLGDAARSTISALERIDSMRGQTYSPASDAKYPDGEFGADLMQTARLIKAKVGLEAVAVDLDGWDSHFVQGTLMEPLMTQLAQGLTAFHKDLGARMETVSVVVMTEFGRRVRENSAFGTDHGRGSIMMLMGGGVLGGRVHNKWEGLADHLLVGPGDLPVHFNYRDALAPILARHGDVEDFSRIFPGYSVNPLSLFA